jgi:hypothetical protein
MHSHGRLSAVRWRAPVVHDAEPAGAPTAAGDTVVEVDRPDRR